MKKRGMAVTFLIGMVIGGFSIEYLMMKDLKNKTELADKHLSIVKVFNQWMIIKHKNKSVADYLIGQGYKNIAIYGMSFLGERLLEELQESNIQVKYAIDKSAGSISANIRVISPDQTFDEVDAIVVSSSYYFDDIYKTLSQKVEVPIINLEDVLYKI